jgi:hypothetical protein
MSELHSDILIVGLFELSCMDVVTNIVVEGADEMAE